MSFQKISFENKNGIYYLGLGLNNDKSMTTLTEESLKELREALLTVSNDANAEGLVIFSHKQDVFLAGMDVSVIQGLSSEAEAMKGVEEGQDIFNLLEDIKCNTMALVDGICLGGGLELSLACDKIICSDNEKTSLGLPEVMLGVLPGFGGSYRLPRKVGLPNALDMILTGKQVKAKKALKLGLCDYVMPRERMIELAPEYLKKKSKIEKKTNKEIFQDKLVSNFIARKIIFQKAREQVLKTTKGFYPAPLRILDHLENSFGRNRKTYLANEARAFSELAMTAQAKNLQHVFFLQDNAKKMDGKIDLKKIEKGAVLGAGTMGGGIAWLFANYNQNPIMKDIAHAGLELGLKQSSSIFKNALKKKKISEADFQRKQRSITPTLNFDGFKNVDLVVEAVVENMHVKKKVLAEVEGEVQEDALLTTNTSSLSVEDMASALKNSSRFAGLHFFNPVNKMPLVEIIRHKNVSEKTIASLYKWCLAVKKTPVVVNDGPGFLVNRILAPFLNESAYLLKEGVSIEALDRAILNFGFPMGPCRLMDEIGLDVCAHVGKIMEEGLGKRAKACDLSDALVENKFLGKKTSLGFYEYDKDGKSMGRNEAINKILPTKTIIMEEKDIQMRVILPMINEAANILKDGIVSSAETVDLGLIFGIGFPPFRGGLLRYADSQGVNNIKEAILKYKESVDLDRFELSSYIEELTLKGKGFY